DTDENGVIEVAGVVGETQLVVLSDLKLAAIVDHFDGTHVLADFARAIARIAPHGSADGAWDADEGFESGQALSSGCRNESGQRCTRAGADLSTVNADLGKSRFAQANDDALHPFIADENV